MLRLFGRQTATLSRRAISTTAARAINVQLSESDRDRIHPRIGNRDIVCWGFNGVANYWDQRDFPCPAIRFKANTADVLALREKEKGDWQTLSLEDKKALYRASFCQTFAEMNAATGEWKHIMSLVFFGIGLAGWIFIWLKNCVYPPLPSTITSEWQEANLHRMILQRQGPVEGVSSKWDYDKGDWK